MQVSSSLISLRRVLGKWVVAFQLLLFLGSAPVFASALIPQVGWTLKSVDSQETRGEDGAATNAFDGDVRTFWHTQWQGASPRHPHRIDIDLGAVHDLDGFRYLPRQDGGVNGRVARYAFYVSLDGVNWGSAVATGTFRNSAQQQEVSFALTQGRYIRFEALSEVNGRPWTTVAELKLLGAASSKSTNKPESTNKPAIPISPARYLSEDFESANWVDRYNNYTYVGNVTREGGVAARSGSYGIRMNVKKGSHWGGRLLLDHSRHGQGGNFKEIWARYYVRFGPNWRRDDLRGAKAGFRVRSDEACGAPCLEMTDMHRFRESGSIQGNSYFHRNVSDADIQNRTYKFGSQYWSGGDRERERWYCVEAHHVLNTPGQSNGIYQNWLDGTLVSDHHNLRQRDSATLNIDHSALITYVGGSWVADRDMNIYYDDWAVSDKRIGCL